MRNPAQPTVGQVVAAAAIRGRSRLPEEDYANFQPHGGLPSSSPHYEEEGYVVIRGTDHRSRAAAQGSRWFQGDQRATPALDPAPEEHTVPKPSFIRHACRRFLNNPIFNIQDLNTRTFRQYSTMTSMCSLTAASRR